LFWFWPHAGQTNIEWMGAQLARREGAATRRDDNRTVWVLDTETKGTGAEMVPLEKLQQRRRGTGPSAPITLIRRDRRSDQDRVDAATREPGPRAPRRFKVAGVMSGEVVAEDVGSLEAIQALRPFPSVFDVRIHVWEPEDEEWRLLTLAEKKAMWAFREHA
jgi:hypothetical protein